MEIIVNGKPHLLPSGASIAELLEQLDLTGRRIALEVNETIVPRSRYGEHQLAAGDRVEIVHAIGGG
ncbi:MAG TPA: sulfur carrier protein ThiS [Gammaproteobacteria bacterium]|nr:sulfur carrier protein ThiS [Gammaproteobacteria bacterium]